MAERKYMYKLPWSTTDNQGGWIEVTDNCNLDCPGCYRQRLEGDKPLEKVKSEILRCKQITNCDTMVIAGGEPLIYPYIIEVVRFISSLGLKPLILTNGLHLTIELLLELKNAGLKRIHFHVDAQQNREGWKGADETVLNELRQSYAEMLWKVKGIQCGFHITFVRETMQHIPAIMNWYRRNTPKVQHISLIALRGFPVIPGSDYYANGITIDQERMFNSYTDPADIEISTQEILDTIQRDHPGYLPSAYINGDQVPEINKQLFIISIASTKAFFGVMGARSMELTQAFHHLIKGRYFSFLPDPAVGLKIFWLSLFDKQLRKTFRSFVQTLLQRPAGLFEKIYLQSLIIQQPVEFIGNSKNTCEHCVNPMVYNDLVINPCELDQFRVYGNLIVSLKNKTESP